MAMGQARKRSDVASAEGLEVLLPRSVLLPAAALERTAWMACSQTWRQGGSAWQRFGRTGRPWPAISSPGTADP